MNNLRKFVEYEVKDRIGYITLNRPDKRNALNHDLVAELSAVFTQADLDEQVKVVVLRARGSAFCAGADLEYLQQLQNYSYEENLEDSRHLQELLLQIYTLSKVVIAEIQGHAIAGGCGLASVCDFAFAAPEAKFGYTEVKIGFIPAIVMVFLLRKIGEQKAKALLLSGRLISADEAAKLDLINIVVPAEELADTVFSFARELIVKNSTQSMAATKKMIADIPQLSLQQALDHAVEMNAKARSTEDCQKGIRSFLNKEDLTW
jgi:methylglutaconyl-CoA hydratase